MATLSCVRAVGGSVEPMAGRLPIATTWRCAVLSLMGAAMIGLCVAIAPAAEGSAGHRRCGFYRGHATYQQGSHRWGAYVLKGKVSCARALFILRRVERGAGAFHDTGSFPTSYTLYRSWRCQGQSGTLYCSYPDVSPGRATKEIMGADCVASGCPKRLPSRK